MVSRGAGRQNGTGFGKKLLPLILLLRIARPQLEPLILSPKDAGTRSSARCKSSKSCRRGRHAAFVAADSRPPERGRFPRTRPSGDAAATAAAAAATATTRAAAAAAAAVAAATEAAELSGARAYHGLRSGTDWKNDWKASEVGSFFTTLAACLAAVVISLVSVLAPVAAANFVGPSAASTASTLSAPTPAASVPAVPAAARPDRPDRPDWRNFLGADWRQVLRADEKAAWRRVPKSVLKRLRSVAQDLSDLQQDIYDEDWQNISIYPGLLQAYVPLFTRYTDTAFQSDSAVDRTLRVSLRYAVGAFYRHVRELEAAVEVRSLAKAEEASARMALAYDNYLKAGDLYEGYDPVPSTEVYYKGIPDSQLEFAPTELEPPTVRDKILVIVGPDKGKTGRILWVGQIDLKPKFAIVKLDYNGNIQASEVKTYSYSWVARTSDTQSTFFKDIIAAFVAATIASTLTYPIETYKVRLQAGKSGWPSEEEGGPFNLFQGLQLNLVRQAPNASILMSVFNFLQRAFLKAVLQIPAAGLSGASAVRFLVMIPAGALANMSGSVIRVPFELINKQVQLGKAADFDEAVKIVFGRPGALTKYFASWAAILVRDVPFGVVQLVSFEVLKDVTSQPLDLLHVNIFGQRLIWGFIAGSLAAYATVPADNVVTRVVEQVAEGDADDQKSVSETVWSAGQDILREKGPEGFWVGANERALYYGPQSCLFFSAYDTIVNLL
ncbi:unnamed protein product [Polarella glacialis]|uniref:Uncharacterized protein n=1 Tax=Polarella glacialis TaxID=89957 RepID=A0A813GSQ1_POLGL|nr:unnamed protein product [Polarella glacialis]